MDLNTRAAALTRKAMVVLLALAALVYAEFWYFEDEQTGLVAASSFYLILTAVLVFRDLTLELWFWLALTVVIILHVALIFEIPWAIVKFPTPLLPYLFCAPVLDFTAIYWFVCGLEKLSAKS